MRKLHTAIFLFLTFFVYSQNERPKVGLVLSGGSAHGIAHIGVLKVLEEQGVHVDYITGTSMGAIMGGLYSMGLSASEIEKITREQDWSKLLATEVPLRDIAPSEKYYHNRFPLTMEFRDGGLKLPQGFFNSQKLDLELNRLFGPAYQVNDFDSLPIPFKCMAVNIETGEIEILDKGFLGNAVRSSMAIPSVFSPVERDEKLLVDGGLIRNFPVEEVLEMGADIVIGVYVGSRLEEKEKLNNLVEILNQSAFMMGILDSEEQKKLVDVLIEPDVKEMPSFGFDKTDVLIREGYIAAMHQLELIKEIAKRQKLHEIPDVPELESVEIVNLTDTRFPFIMSPFDAFANFKYGIFQVGEVSLHQIEKGINRMFGTKHFENINYSFQLNSRGQNILNIDAKPRKLNAISGTLNYMASSNTAIVLTSEIRNFLGQPSILHSTFRLAENFGVKFDYNYRVGKKKDFILNIMTKAHRYDQNLYEIEILRERYAEINGAGKINLGFEPNNIMLIQAGMGIDGHYIRPIGFKEDDFQSYQRLDGVVSLSFTFDTKDDVQIPTSGVFVQTNLSYRSLLSNSLNAGNLNILKVPQDQSHFEGNFKLYAFYPLNNQIGLEANLSGGYKSNNSLTNNYRIGGLEDRDGLSIAMLGLNTHQVHFWRYYKGGLTLRIEIFNDIFLSLKTDYLRGRQAFRLSDAVDMGSLTFWGYGGMISMKSPLGPLKLSYGRNTLTNSWNTNFVFGYSFF